MKNNLEAVQDILDAGGEIPPELYARLSPREKRLAGAMGEIREGAGPAMTAPEFRNGGIGFLRDEALPGATVSPPGRSGKTGRLVLAAALVSVVLAAAILPPAIRSLGMRRLLREDARLFTESLFQEELYLSSPAPEMTRGLFQEDFLDSLFLD